ncbi:hypothetical protein [Paenibacillus abyssi]|uniref:Uncharacterized protein n=1 Tax=Paenibacillus abyssi TaxID=1340531 RepID=A0A917FVL4_9BACL|nr:hypothetical protein [Paenibacillus abyssi]GGG09457.1 hypothetical protein GCM10010916_27870 [Paenibacillus abyssi]
MYNQQGSFQAQSQSSFNQSNRYQPAGYVQSYYQGQMRQGGGISAQNTGPVISKIGYQAAPQQSYASSGSYGQQQGMMNSFTNAQTQQQQPVISHLGGYTANQQQNFARNPVISHLGTTAGQDFGQYNQYNQSQPMTSNMGYQASGNMDMGMQNNYGQHPVYQATNSKNQDGPVYAQVGYQAGTSNQQYGQNNMNRF